MTMMQSTFKDGASDKTLNTGFGWCRPEATTKVVAPMSWISEGREMQFAATVLAAVHDHNRHAADGEHIALDFPTASFRAEVAGKPGPSARLVGSFAALEAIQNSDRLLQFRRRVIRNGQQLISEFEVREEGYCLVRSRQTEKVQPGELRRKIARAKRRGKLSPDRIAQMEARLAELMELDIAQRRALAVSRRSAALKVEGSKHHGLEGYRDCKEAAVFLGEKPFMFRRKRVATVPGARCLVSTYGMSSSDAPVIFDAWIEDTGSRGKTAPASAMARSDQENLMGEDFA